MTLASRDFSGQLKRPGSMASEVNHSNLSALPQRRTILVVETDQVISMIAITLQTAGYSVVLAVEYRQCGRTFGAQPICACAARWLTVRG
jgi:hypothetical protein